MSKEVRIERLAEALEPVSSPQGLKIVMALNKREMTVSELSKLLNVGQSRTSQKLRSLRYAGVVKVCKKEGAKRYYCLTDLGKQIANVINRLIDKEE